ncbi:MAG: hypothetical protein IJ428_00955 [Clostridia bacterium]|nr:hypothetical protein [Clostridia bacterium]
MIFFSSREVADLLDKSNPAECAEGVTMRPHATIVPTIPFDANMPDDVEIKKRIYYGSTKVSSTAELSGLLKPTLSVQAISPI